MGISSFKKIILLVLYANSYADSQSLLDEIFNIIWSIFHTFISALAVTLGPKAMVGPVNLSIMTSTPKARAALALASKLACGVMKENSFLI